MKFLQYSILLLVYIGITNKIHSQQTDWAPVGATWYYNETFPFSGDIDFLKITSTGDTVIKNQNCKILESDGLVGYLTRPTIEYMYESEDIIYYFESELDTFLVLYDFGAEEGEDYMVMMKDWFGEYDSSIVHIDSVGVIDINGSQRRLQYVTISNLDFAEFHAGPEIYSSRIIEGIGDVDMFLFNFHPYHDNVAFDGNVAQSLRCYQDSIVGLYSTGIVDSCDAVYPYVDHPPEVYRPIDFENGIWVHEGYEKGPLTWYDQLYCDGDTMIGGYKAYRLKKIQLIPKMGEPGFDISGPTNEGLIYENGIKQVFFKPETEDGFDLIYDFNIELYDTVYHGEDTFIVNGIDSVEICGIYHKRYKSDQYCYLPEQNVLIEGIGFSNGLLGPNQITCGESHYYLYCYTERQNTKCSDCNPVVGNQDKDMRLILYPNPASSTLRIEIDQQKSSECIIFIYDSFGRLVTAFNEINGAGVELDVSAFKPGIYFYSIFNENEGEGLSGKFVVK